MTNGYYIHLRVNQHTILPDNYIEPFDFGTSISIHGYLQHITKLQVNNQERRTTITLGGSHLATFMTMGALI